jgi:hypothetical protein
LRPAATKWDIDYEEVMNTIKAVSGLRGDRAAKPEKPGFFPIPVAAPYERTPRGALARIEQPIASRCVVRDAC